MCEYRVVCRTYGLCLCLPQRHRCVSSVLRRRLEYFHTVNALSVGTSLSFYLSEPRGSNFSFLKDNLQYFVVNTEGKVSSEPEQTGGKGPGGIDVMMTLNNWGTLGLYWVETVKGQLKCFRQGELTMEFYCVTIRLVLHTVFVYKINSSVLVYL